MRKKRREWERKGGMEGGGGEGNARNKDLTVLGVLLGILRGKQSRLLCSWRGSSRSSWMCALAGP